MTFLLPATILLFAVWPAYALLLRYSERYVLNRLLLLLAMVAVCALPFMSFESPAPVATETIRGTIEYVEQVTQPSVEILPAEQVAYDGDAEGTPYTEPHGDATGVTVNTLNLIYLGGAAVLFLVLGFRLLLLFVLHLRSRPNGDDSYRLLHPGAGPGQAFTFLHHVYFSIDVPDGPDFDHVLAHERIHARQAHTVDILLSEVFLCLFWFHPTAWWLRTQLRANLEFLVDRAVVRGGADRRDYQLALVRQSQSAQGLALALPFSEPSLKSRISRLTGMPEYRLVAVLAAVALVFWLAVTVLVVRGTVTADTPVAEREYLAASAPAGDYYANHFRGLVDGPLTSLEVYTNRMVTVDEYLQLRGILSMVPGARLYVYKQPFDKGYTLELKHNFNETAVVHFLKPEPSTKFYGMIGMEFSEGAGHVPIAMHLQTDWPNRDGDGKSDKMITYKTSTQTGSEVNFFNMPEQLVTENVIVYINREKVELLPKADNGVFAQENYDVTVRENGMDISNNHNVTVRVNDVEVPNRSDLGWREVVVEGRSRLAPRLRMANLMAGLSEDEGDVHETHRQSSGTFREWYESFGWPTDELRISRYNDRSVSLNFLLDTEFGDDAMIQVGLGKRDGADRHVIQVIDDTDLTNVVETRALSGIKEVDFYFRRLPTPTEMIGLRNYLRGFTGYELRVFQNCGEAAGNYNLYLGNSSGTDGITKVLSVGEVVNQAFRFNVKKTPDGGYRVALYQTHGKPMPSMLTEIGVYVELNSDGKMLSFNEPSGHYHRAMLDPAPDTYALGCMGTKPVSEGQDSWTMTFNIANDNFFSATMRILEEMEYKDRNLEFYINDESVDAGAFSKHDYAPGARIEMSTWSETPGATVVVRIVE